MAYKTFIQMQQNKSYKKICYIANHYSSVTHSRISGVSIRRGLSRIFLERPMYHVRMTFLLRSRGVSVTYLYSYGLSLSYVRRIKA